MEAKHKINKYTCEFCGDGIFTINRDEGTTPFMVPCMARLGCKGMMLSGFYQDEPRRPGWEWIKPTPEELETYLRLHDPQKKPWLREAVVEHIQKGGLLLRRLTMADLINVYGWKELT